MAKEKKKVNDVEFKKLKEKLKTRFVNAAHIMWGRDLDELTENEIFQTVAATAKQYISENWIKTNKAYMEREEKQIYYFSIEFLMGRLLKSNLINLGLEEAIREVLGDFKLDLDKVYEEEPDAGLGNGGLGRLAACFIDSMAAHHLPGHGCSIRYQYGLFEQKIIDGNQVEIPDNWLKNGFAWEYRKPDKAIDVKFYGNAYMKEMPDGSLKLVHENPMVVMAVPYDVPIVGYHNNTVNNLRLWNAEVNRDFSDYGYLTQEQIRQKNEYRSFVESITRYLYPDDSTWDGRKMRLIQEYFMTSAGVQSIVRHYKKTGMKIQDLSQKIAIHINDTHPAVAVPELMRILIDEEGLEWSEAWAITKNTIAYTNHTIMPEALETWPVDMFKELLPRVYMIIEEINRRHLADVRDRYPNNDGKVQAMSILENGMVHMARLAIVGGHSVNGVAKIHTDILKASTLHDFYEYNPKMFNNKTNGITHRRWLMGANPELAGLIDETLGSRRWHRYPEQLDLLNDFVSDKPFLAELGKIKHLRKEHLAQYILEHNLIKVNPDSIFDIQVKRIHSYKRQLMNILHIMYQYNALKYDKGYDMIPTTYIFGGKAAPGYYIAKETIRLINAVANKVNNDRTIKDKMKIVFIENFGVSIGEIVYPAADVSEQISTASKEASGTGNMKFMMNGAITLGTMDGANVEIREAVGGDHGGDEHCVIFGLRAEDVLTYYMTGTYSAWDEYNSNEMVRFVMNQLIDGTYGDFRSLYDYLIHGNDEFFILKDLSSYAWGHEEIMRRYKDKLGWLKSSAMNIANSGRFSSDRTIDEYANEIWHVKPVRIS
ncbi:starch phosphorylase [Selenomonas ruminantium]|uniref:Alpha-1,4 glucan phosphorylase n=1 Tax=Selenomonas ruminantium TaxID=971 RepID=A0A1M6TJW0_SELRU|nr:glycogen/starch/alpha-glucan phosphorylase [Selenomonas ruminantium]SHK57196.1 starch phosphorylase [Selenomonas ruminantium]